MTDQLTIFDQISTLQTRGEAELVIKPDRKRLQRIVYETIREHGPLTDEIGAQLSGLAQNTYRPRRLELERAGRIVAAGYSHTKSGRKAVAWAISQQHPSTEGETNAQD